jgi:hypothetical protein
MIAFLTSDANIVFLSALILMIVIAAIEGLSIVGGFGLSQIIDSWIPDIDVLDGSSGLPHAGALDTPAALDAAGHGGSIFTKLIGWIRIGKVPVLMVLVVFLCLFGVCGIGIQLLVGSLIGAYPPALLAVPLALVVAGPLTRLTGKGLAQILPGDESSAITDDSFIGRSATIVLGTAQVGTAVQAKVRDEHGQHHYVLVELDEGQAAIPSGGRVILVKKVGARFFCIEDDTD